MTAGLILLLNQVCITGYPHVTCGVHSIRVDVDAERPFQGRVFVKGESYNKDCIRSFAGSPAAFGSAPVAAAPASGPYGHAPAVSTYGETVGIELGFGQCNMRRQRTVSDSLVGLCKFWKNKPLS